VILLPASVRIDVATAPTNLRKSFEGLSNEVRSALAADPISGHVFLFLNRKRSQGKLLVWTRGGFTMVHKRLDHGTFPLPVTLEPGAKHVAIGAEELHLLLGGVPGRVKRRTPRGPLLH
jgi:transposase